MIEFQLSDAQAKRLEEAMAKIGAESEDLVNAVLETKGTKLMIQKIIEFMPQSKKNKRHARQSNPLRHKMFNLGFETKTKGGAAKNKNSFGYLVFPDEGRGPRNPVAQKFVDKGAESANELILQELLDAIYERQIELLGG